MKNNSSKNVWRFLATLGAVVSFATGCVPTSRYVYRQDKDGNVTIIREGVDYWGGSAVSTDGKPGYKSGSNGNVKTNNYYGTAGQWLQSGHVF